MPAMLRRQQRYIGIVTNLTRLEGLKRHHGIILRRNNQRPLVCLHGIIRQRNLRIQSLSKGNRRQEEKLRKKSMAVVSHL